MKNPVKHVLLGLCVLGLGAVYYITARPNSPPTISWYTQNKQALSAQIQKCSANPGELVATINCQNAYSAQEQIDKAAKKPTHPSSAKRYGIIERNTQTGG